MGGGTKNVVVVTVVVAFFCIHFFSVSNPSPERRKELGLRRAKLGLASLGIIHMYIPQVKKYMEIMFLIFKNTSSWKMDVIFSERSEAELRSPEAELFSSLGNWVRKEKKWIKKKRYDDDGDHVFCTTPPIFLANFKKMSVFEENLRILKHNF